MYFEVEITPVNSKESTEYCPCKVFYYIRNIKFTTTTTIKIPFILEIFISLSVCGKLDFTFTQINILVSSLITACNGSRFSRN
jgi:hypothetical protein